MRVTTVVHHMMPFIAVVGGALILLMPRLLNYVVAIYLILVGVIGINSIFHFVRWRAGPGALAALDRVSHELDELEELDDRHDFLFPDSARRLVLANMAIWAASKAIKGGLRRTEDRNSAVGRATRSAPTRYSGSEEKIGRKRRGTPYTACSIWGVIGAGMLAYWWFTTGQH
jgi:hypothetical protein